MEKKKIVIIGAGPGGYVAALRAAALGGDVTIIEKEHLGGVCLNWGCIPSKIMKTSADIYLKLKQADEFGIKTDGKISPDMAAIMLRKEKICEIQRKGIASLLQRANITVESGRGVIKGSGIAAVITKDEYGNDIEKEIAYQSLIIATGSVPLNIPAIPFDGEVILSSNDLLSLNEIPESIVIVGGGVIGCEFACILSALDSKVTIVEAMSRLLPLSAVDISCSATLQREMKKRGIKIITDKVVEKAEKIDSSCELNSRKKLIVTLGDSPFTDKFKTSNASINKKQTENQQPQIIEAEKAAVCIGRSPLSSNLGLENIGLKIDEKGWIEVNELMETSVKGVYAIGDILGPNHIMLAHAASHEGMVAASNAMDIKPAINMDYNAVPSAIFTIPEIANVGLTEVSAKNQGFDAISSSVNFRILGKAHAIGEIAGEAKIVADAKTGKVLGVHIIGAHATDLIAEATLAVNKGLTVSDIANTIHAHPTLAEIMSEAALKLIGIAVHG